MLNSIILLPVQSYWLLFSFHELYSCMIPNSYCDTDGQKMAHLVMQSAIQLVFINETNLIHDMSWSAKFVERNVLFFPFFLQQKCILKNLH